jgi:endonuclease YncB( thermonuclease family)
MTRHHRLFIPVLVSLWWCLTPLGAFAERMSGRVVGIVDGDTIEVLHDNKLTERISLHGIDCPEKGQAYGTKARQAMSNLVSGKEVTLETHGLDKHGRTIADVSLPEGINVSLELVRTGWCWWYPQDAPNNVILAELQRRARRAGLGLWADPKPVPPWEWRKRK